MNEAESFFFEHAGWSYDPKTETPDQGRERGARELAEAERRGKELGWSVDWDVDPDPMTDDDVDREEEYAQYVANLSDGDGTYLASLGSVEFGPKACMGYNARPGHFEGGPLEGTPLVRVEEPYARVVEAELMYEALREYDARKALESFVLVVGNPVDGLFFTGPFATEEDATEAGEEYDGDWWVAPLGRPRA